MKSVRTPLCSFLHDRTFVFNNIPAAASALPYVHASVHVYSLVTIQFSLEVGKRHWLCGLSRVKQNKQLFHLIQDSAFVAVSLRGGKPQPTSLSTNYAQKLLSRKS